MGDSLVTGEAKRDRFLEVPYVRSMVGRNSRHLWNSTPVWVAEVHSIVDSMASMELLVTAIIQRAVSRTHSVNSDDYYIISVYFQKVSESESDYDYISSSRILSSNKWTISSA